MRKMFAILIVVILLTVLAVVLGWLDYQRNIAPHQEALRQALAFTLR